MRLKIVTSDLHPSCKFSETVSALEQIDFDHVGLDRAVGVRRIKSVFSYDIGVEVGYGDYCVEVVQKVRRIVACTAADAVLEIFFALHLRTTRACTHTHTGTSRKRVF